MIKKKINFSKVTLNKNYDSFPISPKHLGKEYIKFVYQVGNDIIEKVVPMTYIGPRLEKPKHIWHRDEFTDEKEYYGYFYPIKAKYIFDY